MSDPLSSIPLAIGPWQFEPELCRLSRDGEARHLSHKVMRVLSILASRPGRVVSKEELVTQVWDGDSTSDEAIAAVVYELRKVLGDSAKAPRFIETIRKGGYRLIADVEPLAPLEAASVGLAGPAGPSGAVVAQKRVAQNRDGRSLRRFGLAAVLAVAAFCGGFAAWKTASPLPSASSPRLMVRSLAVVPLAAVTEECKQDFFSQGLTEMLVAELAAGPAELNSGLSLPANPERWEVLNAASELNVDGVVEGSVVRSGDRVWVSMQLIEALTGKVLWGGIYERQVDDLYLLQRELSLEIAEQIESHLAL